MDTAILIQFIEAERNLIDPQHRSLECDKLAYGIISRVMNGIYAAKKEAERAAHIAAHPELAASMKNENASLYSHEANPHLDKDNLIHITCGICGQDTIVKTRASKMCKKRECKLEYYNRRNRKYANKTAQKNYGEVLEKVTEYEDLTRAEKKSMHNCVSRSRMLLKKGHTNFTKISRRWVNVYNNYQRKNGREDRVITLPS